MKYKPGISLKAQLIAAACGGAGARKQTGSTKSKKRSRKSTPIVSAQRARVTSPPLSEKDIEIVHEYMSRVLEDVAVAVEHELARMAEPPLGLRLPQTKDVAGGIGKIAAKAALLRLIDTGLLSVFVALSRKYKARVSNSSIQKRSGGRLAPWKKRFREEVLRKSGLDGKPDDLIQIALDLKILEENILDGEQCYFDLETGTRVAKSKGAMRSAISKLKTENNKSAKASK